MPKSQGQADKGKNIANFINPSTIEEGVKFLRESGRLSFEAEGLDQVLVKGLLEHLLLKKPLSE